MPTHLRTAKVVDYVACWPVREPDGKLRIELHCWEGSKLLRLILRNETCLARLAAQLQQIRTERSALEDEDR